MVAVPSGLHWWNKNLCYLKGSAIGFQMSGLDPGVVGKPHTSYSTDDILANTSYGFNIVSLLYKNENIQA